MAESTTEFPERRAARYEAEIQQAKRELMKIRWRLVSSNATLAFLKVLKSARQFVDGTIVWRPGAILIVATMIGGVGVGVFQSPAFSAVGVSVAIVTLFVLLLFPSDAKVTERVERLQGQQAEMKSRASESSARRHELESVLQAASDQLKNERLALEYRRKPLLAELKQFLARWKMFDCAIGEFESFLERVFTELGYTVETSTSLYRNRMAEHGISAIHTPTFVLSQRGRRIAVNVFFLNCCQRSVLGAKFGRDDFKCDAVVIIPISGIETSALDFAGKNGFKLIDENALTKLILGQADL